MSEPRTAHNTEEIKRITVQWAAEILEEPEMTAQDNFLDLGGHSILALRLCRYAAERFGVEYDIMTLFEQDLAAAAEDLATKIASARSNPSGKE
ncbi:acyl carrier protein [Actinopolyspora saharensis]|uniref:Phosphopantetheine attachment site n=1 Tax=Actinopolyspora saharensis TaxID=995062 RepID=A0A1H1FB11_9ACTN|nr:acyl carrier protein [Actinopolyspora saharensis]SDQ98162.1 Phosphopantetheine attachment site [Actinopolyspora saharensis]